MVEVLRIVVHYSMHLLLPGLVAWVFFRSEWRKAWVVMVLTMLVDFDHLFSDPVFDAGRCSIGYHPLHSYIAIVIYGLLLLVPSRTVKMIGAGLVLHMVTDYQDYLWVVF